MSNHYIPAGSAAKLKEKCAPKGPMFRVPDSGRRVKGLVPSIEATAPIDFVTGTFIQVPLAPFMKNFTDDTSTAPFQAGKSSTSTSLTGNTATITFAPTAVNDPLAGLTTSCFHYYRKRNQDMGNTNLDTWEELNISVYKGNVAGDLSAMTLVNNFILTEQTLSRRSRSIIEFRLVLAKALNGGQGSLDPVTFAYTSASDITGIKLVIVGSSSTQFDNKCYLPSQLAIKELASWKRSIHQ